MIYIHWAILILVLVVSHSTLAKSYTLKELIDIALKNSPDYKISQANLTVTKFEKENSFSAFLPSLDIQAIQGYQDRKPIRSDDNWTSELKLSLSSQIYNNGINFLNYDKSKLSLSRAEIEYKRNIANICLKLSKGYYRYSLLNETHKIQRSQLSQIKKQFLSVKNQYEQGRKTRIDFIRFKSRLQRAKLSVSQAEVEKKKSLEDIVKLIAWERPYIDIKVDVAHSFSRKYIPQEKIDIKSHYDAQIAHFSKAINNLNIDLEKRRYGPEIFLDTGASYANSNYLGRSDSFSNDYKANWSALLTVKFNLWDWGIRRKSVSIQKNKAKRENFKVDNTLLILKANINKLMLDIDQQEKNYFLNKELVELEEKNYKTIDGNYKRGEASFLDLIDSLDNLTSAKESYLSSYFQLKGLLAEYFYHQGNIYEKIGNN